MTGACNENMRIFISRRIALACLIVTIVVYGLFLIGVKNNPVPGIDFKVLHDMNKKIDDVSRF